jgi:hypothetical protein
MTLLDVINACSTGVIGPGNECFTNVTDIATFSFACKIDTGEAPELLNNSLNI